MSDRVARLAEIRRRRQEAGAKQQDHAKHNQEDGASGEHESSPQITEEPRNETRDTDRDVPVTRATSNSAGDKQGEDGSGNKVSGTPGTIVAETEQPDSAHPNDSDTDGNGSENQNASKLTYNSDLKRDLEPYLRRARLDTNRAINQYLQKQYRETLAHTESE